MTTIRGESVTSKEGALRLIHPRIAWLAALFFILWLRVPYSAVHTDLARDMFIAWRALHGESFPMSGPVLAGSIHLGPIYYWLLTLLLAITRGWFGTVLMLGALAAVQIPLAYLAGKELHSRSAGLLWASLLAVPCWSSFEWVFPGHTLLTMPLVLAFVLSAARYVRRPRLRYLIGMALTFVLALHAHPTCLALAWIGGSVLAWSVAKAHCRIRDLVVALLVGLLPLVPYLIWDASQGFADFRAGLDYLGSDDKTGHLSEMPSIFSATLLGGTAYWFATVFAWPGWIANVAMAAIGSIGAAGGVGILFALNDPRWRRMMLFGLGFILLVLLTTALIRNGTPYYMTTLLRVALTGVIALGLASVGQGAFAIGIRACVLLIAVSASALCTAQIGHLQRHGNWPFGFFPLFDVNQARQPVRAQFLLPASAAGRSGRFLCAEPAPAIHGAFAQQELYNYAIDMRLACGRGDVAIAGDDPNRSHWLGLSRDLFARLGIKAQRNVGSLGLIAAHPISTSSAAVPATPIYPPYVPIVSIIEERRIRVHLSAGDYLAISNLAFFVPDPAIVVTEHERAIEPRAVDSVTRVYACETCDGQGTDADVSISTQNLVEIDIATFGSGRLP